MRVNIFGVGRSGTKSLQLFISYALLQKNNEIKINYEPYFWATRLLGVKSFDGIRHHLTTKHFTRKVEDFSNEHQAYLKSMVQAPVVVSKFIRANGRIEPISKITESDYDILIMRDLNDVINSLQKQAFDFTSIGSKIKINYLKQFLKDAKQSGLKIDDRKSPDVIAWDLYNQSAQKVNNLIIIKYENLNDPDYLSDKLAFLDIDKSFCEKYREFRGNQIHDQTLLKNKAKVNPNTLSDKMKFYSVFRFNHNTKFSNQIIGDNVTLA